MFKKFIETGGKSLEEIRKDIDKMVNRAIDSLTDTIADDLTQFAPRSVRTQFKETIKETREQLRNEIGIAEKIPPRQLNSGSESQPHKPEKPNPIYYPHEPVSESLNPHDEFILEKIYEMRKLEVVTNNTYLTSSAALENLITQGQFMSDIEDDYGHNAFCGLAKPIHAMMSVSQLRTYFTWRTDARRGKYNETDKPYVLLYCYELLNKIGAANSEDAFSKLVEVYKNCVVFVPSLRNFLPRWIKDFYAYNNISAPLPDFSGDIIPNGSDAMEVQRGDYSDKLDYLAANSTYSVKDSIFITDNTRPLMNKACELVLNALETYFRGYGAELSELICGKMKKDLSWTPFTDALVDLSRQDGFHETQINAVECYSLKRGKPVPEFFEFEPSRSFIGYVLKSIEACLRARTGFKHSLKPSITQVENEFKNRSKLMAAISSKEFPELIKKTVNELCDEKGFSDKAKASKHNDPIKVEIDVSKLDAIRKLSDENTEKLVVSDENDIDLLSESIADKNFDDQVKNYREIFDSQEQEDPDVFETLPSGWREFAQSLDPDEVLYLKDLLNNSDSSCRQKHLSAELMAENINNIALTFVNDVVIEDGMLIDDYVNNISQVCDIFE